MGLTLESILDSIEIAYNGSTFLVSRMQNIYVVRLLTPDDIEENLDAHVFFDPQARKINFCTPNLKRALSFVM